ncbi:MAG: hypothetical protein M1524_04200 [Patescibacteria group bacterium]|nr:hypothetical protein [Patescibacteria group bacterium]
MRTKKKCSTCRKTLSISEFYRNRTRPDGLGSECKDCAKERSRKYGRRVYGHRSILPRISNELKKTHKQCPTCKQIKIHGYFYVDKKRYDHLSWQCKNCENIRKREEKLRKKYLSSEMIRAIKKSLRIENTVNARVNRIVIKISEGKIIKKFKNLNLPDDPVVQDLMDKPKKILLTTKKAEF